MGGRQQHIREFQRDGGRWRFKSDWSASNQKMLGLPKELTAVAVAAGGNARLRRACSLQGSSTSPQFWAIKALGPLDRGYSGAADLVVRSNSVIILPS